MKGILEIPMFLLIGLVIIMSVFIFFIFFKVHVKSIAVDVENINRYQEVVTAVLGVSVKTEPNTDFPKDDLGRDLRKRDSVNCFMGDGPAGKHDVKESLCSRPLAFYLGKRTDFFSKIDKAPDDGEYSLSDFLVDLRGTMPVDCYSVSRVLSSSISGASYDSFDVGGFGCDLNSPKIFEGYPVPIISGGPSVAEMAVKIGQSSENQDALIRWPKYDYKEVVGLVGSGSK